MPGSNDAVPSFGMPNTVKVKQRTSFVNIGWEAKALNKALLQPMKVTSFLGGCGPSVPGSCSLGHGLRSGCLLDDVMKEREMSKVCLVHSHS